MYVIDTKQSFYSVSSSLLPVLIQEYFPLQIEIGKKLCDSVQNLAQNTSNPPPPQVVLS